MKIISLFNSIFISLLFVTLFPINVFAASTTFQTAGSLLDSTKWSAGLPDINTDAIITADGTIPPNQTFTAKSILITTGSISRGGTGLFNIVTANGITVNKTNGDTYGILVEDDINDFHHIVGNLVVQAGVGIWGSNFVLDGNVTVSGGVGIKNEQQMSGGITINGDVEVTGSNAVGIDQIDTPIQIVVRDIINNLNYPSGAIGIKLTNGNLICRDIKSLNGDTSLHIYDTYRAISGEPFISITGGIWPGDEAFSDLAVIISENRTGVFFYPFNDLNPDTSWPLEPGVAYHLRLQPGNVIPKGYYGLPTSLIFAPQQSEVANGAVYFGQRGTAPARYIVR